MKANLHAEISVGNPKGSAHGDMCTDSLAEPNASYYDAGSQCGCLSGCFPLTAQIGAHLLRSTQQRELAPGSCFSCETRSNWSPPSLDDRQIQKNKQEIFSHDQLKGLRHCGATENSGESEGVSQTK